MFGGKEKQKYRIWKRVMYDEEFHLVAQVYRDATDALQIQFPSFTPEQKETILAYQKAFTQLYEVMLDLSLKHRIW